MKRIVVLLLAMLLGLVGYTAWTYYGRNCDRNACENANAVCAEQAEQEVKQ